MSIIHQSKACVTEEMWKDVVGYEGVYQVSSFGRVKRVKAASGTHIDKVLTPFRQTCGYLVVHLCHKRKRATCLVHRLVALAFLPPSDKSQINHKNGDKTNNRLDNLEWATPKENIQHAYAVLGRKPSQPKGEENRNAKLTVQQVRQVRTLYATDNYSHRALADMYGVSSHTIGRILRCEAWQHVDGSPSISRLVRGEVCHASKLTEYDVKRIRQLYSTGNYSQKDLGRMFGVSQPAIGYIIHRKTWQHVP